MGRTIPSLDTDLSLSPMLPGMHQPLRNLPVFLDSNNLFDVPLQRVVLNCDSQRWKLLQGDDTETVRVPVSDRDLHFWSWHGHVTAVSCGQETHVCLAGEMGESFCSAEPANPLPAKGQEARKQQ